MNMSTLDFLLAAKSSLLKDKATLEATLVIMLIDNAITLLARVNP